MIDSRIENNLKVLNANIAYHTALAETYDIKQPHYKPENVARVEHILADMANRTGGESLLDLGCGTGFIINVAKKYFKKCVGVDITPAMLERVDTSHGQVELYQADTGDIPLPNDIFDVCTACGFLHHLHNLRPTLSEAYRCLRPGGLFYSEQDPNAHYWLLMHAIKDEGNLSEIVAREIQSVCGVSEALAEDFNLQSEVVALAEYQKIRKGGFDAEEVSSLLRDIGFHSVSYQYEWFLGQGAIFHTPSESEAVLIEKYLRDTLPATRSLFKYISFCGEK